VIVMVIVWRLWRSTASDLRELGDTYNVKHLRDVRPTAEAFAASPGFICALPALTVLFRASRYVREAQEAVKLPLFNRRIAWLALVWPVLCVRLQRELNRAWQAIPLMVTTTSLLDGIVNSSYRESLAAARGRHPLHLVNVRRVAASRTNPEPVRDGRWHTYEYGHFRFHRAGD
jgi:hypothetical protein